MKVIRKLSPRDKRFVINYCNGMTQSKALRNAEDVSNYSSGYINVKACRMLRKDNIRMAINSRKAIMEANANLAAQRLQTIITDGDDSNALGASKFVIEQVDGKALQPIQQSTSVVTLSIDLTSSLDALGEAIDEKTDINPSSSNSLMS